MKCPICKTPLDFLSEELEEIYYDCSNCDSSLFIQDGDCQILKEGKIKEKSIEEITQEDLTEPTSEISSRKYHLHKEAKEELEEFIPNEKTQVPELNSIEEESEAGFSKKNREETNPTKEENLSYVGEEQNLEQDLEEETNSGPTKEENLSYAGEEQNLEQDLEGETNSGPTKEENLSYAGEEQNLEQDLEGETNSGPTKEEDFPYTEGEQNLEQDPEEETNSGPTKEEDFSEVKKYGNTQDQERQGSYFYELIINQINSQDLRVKIFAVLDDPSLNLLIEKNSSSTKEKIKDGLLKISKLSPIQTYIIVTSLMGLPLDISWKQQHITEI